MKRSMRTVAVTGLHRGENPQPGASVIASLRRAFPGIRIVGFSYDPMESALYGSGPDRPDAAFLMPFPGAGPQALLERIDMVLQEEDLGFVIPCLDSEIENYTELLPLLRERGVDCILPTERSFQARHKANLYDFCRRHDVPTPMTLVANDPAEVEACAQRIGYPVYIKGRLYHAHLVHSREGLAPAYEEIVETWGWPIIVQENLVGEEYDVTGVGDGKGRIAGSCSIRKLLRTQAGKGFAGIVVENPELQALSEKIIHGLKWNGPFELEFVKPMGGELSLMEINPRFPAWIDFPSQISCNLPALLLERLTHRAATPLAPCPAGRMFVRHSVDVAGDFSEFAQMASTGERVFKPFITEKEATT